MNDFLKEIKDESLEWLDSYFDNDSSQKEENRKTDSSSKVLITKSTENKIIDTLFDWHNTKFIEFDRNSNKVSLKENIKLKNTLYYPLKADSTYIENSVILFSWSLEEYDSEIQLIEDIRGFIHKYVDIQEELEIICVYYVIMTYFFPKFSEVPYLRVIWDYWSWKSRFLKTIWSLCHYPIMVNGWISTPALFRILEKVKWTLVFDEADLRSSDTTNEIVKILNNGFQKWLSILRADWEKFEPISYDVYWPKIIWSREDFKDKALESRCITFIMKRTNRTDIKRNLNDSFENEALILRNKLLKYKYDNYDKVTISEEIIEWLEPRLNQIINPILSLISNDDDRSIVIMNSLNFQEELKKDRFLSVEWQIFHAIYEFFNDSSRTSITYWNILDELGFDYKIHPRRLWWILKNHWIIPHRSNKWFIIDFNTNKDVLEKHYKEFFIIND